MAQAAAPLSKDDIQHFMNAMKPLQELGQKYEFDENKDPPAENTGFTGFSPMTRALEDVKGHASYEEFNIIIHDAGFSSPEQWADVGDRVIRAYTALKVAREMTPEKKQKMMKNIEEVKKNEYLSPELKKQLLESLSQSMTMTDNINAGTKADQESLKPYLDQLERLFEEL